MPFTPQCFNLLKQNVELGLAVAVEAQASMNFRCAKFFAPEFVNLSVNRISASRSVSFLGLTSPEPLYVRPANDAAPHEDG